MYSNKYTASIFCEYILINYFNKSIDINYKPGML